MQHDDLLARIKQSAAIKLLQSQNSPLIISFLHDQFKKKQQITIPHSQLLEELDSYLEATNEIHPDRYKGSAASYLPTWCDDDHRFLRRYYLSDHDDPVYELTADTEQTLAWLEGMQKSDFVGTESRFLRIFDLLQEIVTYSTNDVQTRLNQLEQEKEAIQAEIDKIKSTGKIEQFTQTQIKERFFETNDVARDLLSDFQEVEENFQAIVLQVQKRQLTLGVRKGEIIEHVLDADTLLKESDQGRSFYAFWEFLMSPQRQDQLQSLLSAVYELPDLQQLDAGQRTQLRRLKRNLINAASKIIESNRRLGEQLRKLLSEQNMAEARRVVDLAQEIKKLAIQLTEQLPSNKDFFWLEADPQVTLPLERPLWSPPIKINYADTVVTASETETLTADQLQSLYSQFYIDKTTLWRQIATLLEQQPAVSLAQLTAAYPLTQGLAELVTYVSLAASDEAHSIDDTTWEDVPLSENGRIIRVPQVIFKKQVT